LPAARIVRTKLVKAFVSARQRHVARAARYRGAGSRKQRGGKKSDF
jgi:hypothetical protein